MRLWKNDSFHSGNSYEVVSGCPVLEGSVNAEEDSNSYDKQDLMVFQYCSSFFPCTGHRTLYKSKKDCITCQGNRCLNTCVWQAGSAVNYSKPLLVCPVKSKAALKQCGGKCGVLICTSLNTFLIWEKGLQPCSWSQGTKMPVLHNCNFSLASRFQ